MMGIMQGNVSACIFVTKSKAACKKPPTNDNKYLPCKDTNNFYCQEVMFTEKYQNCFATMQILDIACQELANWYHHF